MLYNAKTTLQYLAMEKIIGRKEEQQLLKKPCNPGRLNWWLFTEGGVGERPF
jgi:hypothetical protein